LPLLFPNPTNGQCAIQANAWAGGQWSAVDARGREVAKGRLSQGTTTVPVAGWSPGVYFIQLHQADCGAISLPLYVSE
jgi:hypothetical protein